MSTPKKVFIIGAGASAEAGLPTGKELKIIISKLLKFRTKDLRHISGDATIRTALISLGDGEHNNNYFAGAKIIENGLLLPRSIDYLIHSQFSQRLTIMPMDTMDKYNIISGIHWYIKG